MDTKVRLVSFELGKISELFDFTRNTENKMESSFIIYSIKKEMGVLYILLQENENNSLENTFKLLEYRFEDNDITKLLKVENQFKKM